MHVPEVLEASRRIHHLEVNPHVSVLHLSGFDHVDELLHSRLELGLVGTARVGRMQEIAHCFNPFADVRFPEQGWRDAVLLQVNYRRSNMNLPEFAHQSACGHRMQDAIRA